MGGRGLSGDRNTVIDYREQVDTILSTSNQRTKLQEDVRQAYTRYRRDPIKYEEALQKSIRAYNIHQEELKKRRKFNKTNDLNDLF